MVQSSVLSAANFAEPFRMRSNAEPNVFASQSHPFASNASHRLPAHPPCLPVAPSAPTRLSSVPPHLPLPSSTSSHLSPQPLNVTQVTTTIMSSIPVHNAV